MRVKFILLSILIALFFASIVSGDTASVTVVRTNVSGHSNPALAQPLMTYKQAETMIKQNKEIIKLLKSIEKNTGRK